MTETIGGFTDQALYGSSMANPRSYGAALFAAAKRDLRIVALGADLTQPTETIAMRDELPDQFFSFGIQEANMIGAAAGMARCGDIPFAHSFCVFVTRRVYDQVANQLAYPKANVKIVGFIPGLSTSLGVSHQAIDDVALMRALPNMVVIEPCGPEQVGAAVAAAIAHDGPVYLRMSIAKGTSGENVPLKSLEIGKAQILVEGRDIAILASGATVPEALRARVELEAHGISATIVNMHSLKPFDTAAVERLARSHQALLTVENHSTIGGLWSATCDALVRASLALPAEPLGVADRFAEGGTAPYLFEKYGFSAAHITAKALELCGR